MIQTVFEDLDALRGDELLSKALESADTGIFMADSSKENEPIIYVDEGFEKLTGYEAFEVIGSNWRSLQNDSICFPTRSEIQEAKERKETISILMESGRKDGTPFWSEYRIQTVYIEALDKEFLVGVQRDVTPLLHIASENERYREALQSLPMPLIPVSDKVAVVPLAGELSESRHLQLLEEVVKYLERERKNFLVVDLSGITKFDDHIHYMMDTLNELLKLMNCRLVLTGITSEMTISRINEPVHLNSIPSYSTIEQALIGLS